MLFLKNTPINHILSIHEMIESIEDALKEIALGRGFDLPRRRIHHPNKMIFGLLPGSVRGAMGAYLQTDLDRRIHRETVILYSVESGAPLILFQDCAINENRTAAAGAIGAKHLARANASRAALFGSAGRDQIRLPFDVFAGLYPTGDFNAHVEPVAGGALILINAGLMDLLFTVLKANLAASGGPKDPPPLRDRQTTMVLAEAFNAYIYGQGSIAAWPLPRLDSDREQILGFVLRAGELFVLGHELGHIVRGHVRLCLDAADGDIGVYTLEAEGSLEAGVRVLPAISMVRRALG